jgi:TonB-dependent receptor
VVKRTSLFLILLFTFLPFSSALAEQEQAGSIRGMVLDKDFDAPLPAAMIQVLETGQQVTTTDQGNFVINQIPPGTYTLVFSKDGYVRQVKSDVVVSSGRLTELDTALAGDFTEMEEFVVQDILQMGTGSEIALLNLRYESPALMDSISSDLMSQAGASDAAGALRLVTGATVQDGKFAVIRGMPDRYVNSQLNGVRLPSADEETRAVELDQFPAAVIESIQVSKTFTPDQQGDASGGAVNVVLKGIPEEPLFFQFKSEISYNSNVKDRDDFLSYTGGGVNFWGRDGGDRDVQWENIGENWTGASGVSTTAAPTDYKWSATTGGKHEFDNGLKVGGIASYFYERDSEFYDDGIDDSYWLATSIGPDMVPRTIQGTPQPGADPPGAFGDFKTKLFDITQATEAVQWGGLLSGGLEWEHQSVNVSYLYTRTTTDKVTLAEDTRGKEYFFPGYDPNDPTNVGNEPDNLDAAPYNRQETLEYTERTIETVIWSGKHQLPFDVHEIGGVFKFHQPEFDWTISDSTADMEQPDKRQFGSLWHAESSDGRPEEWFPFKPAATFTLGNFQRIFKEIKEDSDQYTLNLNFPFEQWSDTDGYLKFGIFKDKVDRFFDQETFSNFGGGIGTFLGGFDDFWSAVFPYQDQPILESLNDVDYAGEQQIDAWYTMLDLPLVPTLSLIGGARFEGTEISITNYPEAAATWLPPGATAPESMEPGEGDVDYDEDDTLPSIGLLYEPFEEIKLRGSYSETVARQTFKELAPVLQQEFLGGPIFIGNPDLQMASLQNYDLRFDYTPYEGSLLSASYFYKDIEDPIEYVQRIVSFDYTTAVNYPSGDLEGYELEARQEMGHLWNPLSGLSLGGNMTVINSKVRIPTDEQLQLAPLGYQRSKRDATNAPEKLYNLYMTYDLDVTDTQFGLFYTWTGDTLVAGAGESVGNIVPDVYRKDFDILNFSISQKLGDHIKLQFKAKNLTNPELETEYRPLGTYDVPKSSHTKGIDYSFSISVKYTF